MKEIIITQDFSSVWAINMNDLEHKVVFYFTWAIQVDFLNGLNYCWTVTGKFFLDLYHVDTHVSIWLQTA